MTGGAWRPPPGAEPAGDPYGAVRWIIVIVVVDLTLVTPAHPTTRGAVDLPQPRACRALPVPLRVEVVDVAGAARRRRGRPPGSRPSCRGTCSRRPHRPKAAFQHRHRFAGMVRRGAVDLEDDQPTDDRRPEVDSLVDANRQPLERDPSWTQRRSDHLLAAAIDRPARRQTRAARQRALTPHVVGTPADGRIRSRSRIRRNCARPLHRSSPHRAPTSRRTSSRAHASPDHLQPIEHRRA